MTTTRIDELGRIEGVPKRMTRICAMIDGRGRMKAKAIEATTMMIAFA